MTQVILGAGGDIGTLLTKELKQHTGQIRLASRNPKPIHGDEELFPTDLLNKTQTEEAIQGTSIAYLVAGLSYDHRVWERDWPVLIDHVIQACITHQVKLVFFDNVYMYDKKAIGNMREDAPLNPPSKKGRVRLEVAQAIQEAIATKGLQALIARSADFYGPGSKNGILNMLVLDPISKGKTPKWQASMNKIHSFTYTPDAAKATAILGNTDSAYNQVWHLPTSKEKWTGHDFVSRAASIKGMTPTHFILRPWMITLGGLFDRTIAELGEMQYQNDRDYFFNSEKFCNAFDFTSTPYEEGIKAVLETT